MWEGEKMDYAQIAKNAVLALTGETVQSAEQTGHDGSFLDFKAVTDHEQVFTVTVNTALKNPAGHLFEGIDPTKARLVNYQTDQSGNALIG
jgi:hypothetical protein